jgi:hypothetical protein
VSLRYERDGATGMRRGVKLWLWRKLSRVVLGVTRRIGVPTDSVSGSAYKRP